MPPCLLAPALFKVMFVFAPKWGKNIPTYILPYLWNLHHSCQQQLHRVVNWLYDEAQPLWNVKEALCMCLLSRTSPISLLWGGAWPCCLLIWKGWIRHQAGVLQEPRMRQTLQKRHTSICFLYLYSYLCLFLYLCLYLSLFFFIFETWRHSVADILSTSQRTADLGHIVPRLLIWNQFFY